MDGLRTQALGWVKGHISTLDAMLSGSGGGEGGESGAIRAALEELGKVGGEGSCR